MHRSDNPYDLIHALEQRYDELNMTACSDINASVETSSSRFVDPDGFFGIPGGEVTWDQIIDYWENNQQDDPILAEYPSFDAWWEVTSPRLVPIEENTAITGADEVTDDILPEDEMDDTYIDPEFASVRDQIVNYNIATEDEIDLVCAVLDDKSVNTLNKILTARTGYDDIETYIGEVYPE